MHVLKTEVQLERMLCFDVLQQERKTLVFSFFLRDREWCFACAIFCTGTLFRSSKGRTMEILKEDIRSPLKQSLISI